ncbi:MAG: ketopantoate reductase family protein [Deltaproteobacteria bacterium]|nr:ketopantoate reductase family protein [Deltaproteobacteria bacterium]
MRFCILGAGGLGSLVGGMLAESGQRVTLVGRPDHVEAIRARGLAISGSSGERSISRGLEAVVSPADARGAFDALILCVKARDTQAALHAAEGLSERIGVALSLQNTVVKDVELADWLGPGRGATDVLGASTTEAATLDGPGRVRHVATAPTAFYFGSLTAGAADPRVAALVDVFGKAGLAAKATDSIRHVEWEKLLQAAVLAAWSVSTLGMLPGRSVAEGLLVREAAEHYVALAKELIGVYRGLGYAPQDFFHPYSRFRELADLGFEEAVAGMQAQGQRMLDLGAVGRPSLHVDVMRGRPTEVDWVVAPFLAEADRLRLEVPTTRAAYRIIRTLEQLNA